MRHDPDCGTIILTETHAMIRYPRRREKLVAEILGRYPARGDEPEKIYLRSFPHSFDGERFNEAGGGCWSATGAVSTVLERIAARA